MPLNGGLGDRGGISFYRTDKEGLRNGDGNRSLGWGTGGGAKRQRNGISAGRFHFHFAVEEGGLEMDVVRLDAAHAEESGTLLVELADKTRAGGLVAEDFPHVGVDVGQKGIELSLRQRGEAYGESVGGGLGQDEPDQFVFAFDVGLLPRLAGGAVEDAGQGGAVGGEFEGGQIGELASVVGQDDG